MKNMIKISVASQDYRIGSEEEYVIDGNDALLKCKIPSFVADFVRVVNWEDDKQNILYPNKNYGNESKLQTKKILENARLGNNLSCN